MDNVNNRGMTVLSEYMYNAATSRKMTLRGALAQLRENANMRTTKEILQKFVPDGQASDDKLQAYLCGALCAVSPELSRDSVRRKVSMWLKDNIAINKPSAIQLGFALGLSYQNADELLRYLCGEGFHWRDPEDIIYGYALMNGISYLDAVSLKQRMEDTGVIGKDGGSASVSVMTEQVRSEAMALENEDELRDFLVSSRESLGKLHNTAYTMFNKYLSLLQTPDVDELYESAFPVKQKSDGYSEYNRISAYSVREILSVYLHNDVIPRDKREKAEKKAAGDDKKSVVLSAVQRSIRQNWPDEIALSKMKSRAVDVNRKVLLLLFLATDGFEETDYDELEDELSPEELFEDTYRRMNTMLEQCGFSHIDPRAPFDWMILFCISAGESDYLDARIEKFLKEIFAEPV